MTELEILKDLENDAREVRLSEQTVFRNILNNKKKQFRRSLLFTAGSFTLLVAAWMIFHCLPLVSGN